MSTLETNLIQPSTGTALTIGASGDAITVPSGATLTAPNHIIQVVNGTVGQTDMANTDDYIGSGLSITPSSTSSKIQIFVDGYVEKTTGSAGNYAELQLHEATTGITTLNNAITYQYTVTARAPFSINFTRSPSTTSSVQYRLYHNEISGGATYRYYQQAWTLMEIAG
tara:strand:+ start:157 stop:660 length:504 start_codon:yes stop_codon:yes gene_type:complete